MDEKPLTNREMSFAKRNGSFEDHFPIAAKQWVFEDNGGLRPDQLPRNSKRLVWWKCDCGHKYQSTLLNRGQCKVGCPICAKKANLKNRLKSVLARTRSLAETHPKLALFWHPTKNTLSPKEITAGSKRVVYWTCPMGHVWQASVKSRARGRGCPDCNNYSTSRLEVSIYCEMQYFFNNSRWRAIISSKEVDILLPEEALAIEVDGGYWHKNKLRQDFEKNEVLESAGYTVLRIRHKTLPAISDQDIVYGDSDEIFDISKKLAEKIIPRLPKNHISAKSLRKYLEGDGLVAKNKADEIISRLPAPPFEDSLAHNNPDIAALWDNELNSPLTPELFSRKSNQSVWWRCAEGHRWQATISSLTRATGISKGCKECWKTMRPTALATKHGILSTQHPDLLSEWDYHRNLGISPDKITSGSAKQVWWKCSNGHSWKSSITARVSAKYGCKICAAESRSYAVSEGDSLARHYPHIIKYWDREKNLPHTPQSISYGSARKFYWRCDCGHKWESTASNASRLRSGCPNCGRDITKHIIQATRISRRGSLAENAPALALLWDVARNSLSPLEVTAGSSREAHWVCSRGHSFTARVKDVYRAFKTSRREGCVKCRKLPPPNA